MNALDVITGSRRWSIQQASCIEWLHSLPSDSLDLVFTSPPYELARHYLEGGKNLGIARRTEDWVKWLVDVITECSRVCKGLVAFVAEGQTKQFRYTAGPLLLAADLHRAGFNLRKPPIFRRVGIPGSGGPDWLRNDYEPIICITRPGKLPWSDPTAMGHTPKYGLGGEMSYRNTEGQRKNARDKQESRERRRRNEFGFTPHSGEPSPTERAKGKKRRLERGNPKGSIPRKNFGPNSDGSVKGDHARNICAIANPGNVISCKVGGGLMGHPLAHENEAPFPLALVEFFVRSFCPPGGIVCDPFGGSFTTAQAAIENDRRFVGCDLRQSQVDLGIRRMASITPAIPGLA